MENHEEITIYDIARQLNISASGVSRVLQDHPGISRRTRKKAREKASQPSYSTNPFARNLTREDRKVIGMIIHELKSSFILSVLAGILKQGIMDLKIMFFLAWMLVTGPGFAQPGDSLQTAGTRTTLHEFRYTNPITRDSAMSMRDHFIIKVNNKWYCVGTSEPVWAGANPGVRLLMSEDLIHWKQHSFLIDAKRLPADCPYNGRFWAPEIHFIKNKYWLTVNSGKVTVEDPKGMKTHNIWLFSSDNVTGPYELVNGPLTKQYNNDATLFEDEDGQTYMYCSGNGLFQAKIDLATGKLIIPIEKFLDKKQPGYPAWMMGGIEGPFVTKKEGIYFMFFSTWTRGYEVGLLKSKSPLGPWELALGEPIFGTRKKGYRAELAKAGGYDKLKFQDTEDPYQETGHNALFEGPDGQLWSSCHYFMYQKRPYPYSQAFEQWEKTPQLGFEPVYYKEGRFYIKGPTWTEQIIEIGDR